MENENLVDRLIQGEIIACEMCNNGYYSPFNTSADKAHSFCCSNPECNSCIIIDPIINIE